MLKAAFVACIVSEERGPCVKLLCRWQPPQSGASESASGSGLPMDDNLAPFCFPLGPDQVQKREAMEAEEYSFTLTGGDGSRLHGFCRRFLPQAATRSARYPQVVCLVSMHAWCALHYKVLAVLEQLLQQDDALQHSPPAAPALLPSDHPAALFLDDLLMQCPQPPVPGHVLRVNYPPDLPHPVSVSPCHYTSAASDGRASSLESTCEYLELQLPADFGNGPWNCGVPLAPALWHVPAPVLCSLVSGLLLERRIIITAQQSDKLTSVVHAAAALIYPFRWQHIYLPLLPAGLTDYLMSPIPYICGLPARFLPLLKSLALEEVTLIDLDLDRCHPLVGSPRDDGLLLPWRKRLIDGFKMIQCELQHPTDPDATPLIAALMFEWFVKLLGSYREAVSREDSDTAAAQSGHKAGGGMESIRSSGFCFDGPAFLAGLRSARQRAFMVALQQSQLWHMFMGERLQLAGEGYTMEDSFERQVAQLGPGGRRVPEQMRALSKKLPKNVTTAAQRSLSAVNIVLAKSSSLRGSVSSALRQHGSTLRELHIRDKATQTLKALRPDQSNTSREGRVGRFMRASRAPSDAVGSDADGLPRASMPWAAAEAPALPAPGQPQALVVEQRDGDGGHVCVAGSPPAPVGSPTPLITLEGDGSFFDGDDDEGEHSHLCERILQRVPPAAQLCSTTAAVPAPVVDLLTGGHFSPSVGAAQAAASGRAQLRDSAELIDDWLARHQQLQQAVVEGGGSGPAALRLLSSSQSWDAQIVNSSSTAGLHGVDELFQMELAMLQSREGDAATAPVDELMDSHWLGEPSTACSPSHVATSMQLAPLQSGNPFATMDERSTQPRQHGWEQGLPSPAAHVLRSQSTTAKQLSQQISLLDL